MDDLERERSKYTTTADHALLLGWLEGLPSLFDSGFGTAEVWQLIDLLATTATDEEKTVTFSVVIKGAADQIELGWFAYGPDLAELNVRGSGPAAAAVEDYLEMCIEDE